MASPPRPLASPDLPHGISGGAVRWQGQRLLLTCHVQPKAKADELCGLHGESLKIRITAPPVEGKANEHLLRFLARCFGVKRAQITLLAGQSSRHKQIAIDSPSCFPLIEGFIFEAP